MKAQHAIKHLTTVLPTGHTTDEQNAYYRVVLPGDWGHIDVILSEVDLLRALDSISCRRVADRAGAQSTPGDALAAVGAELVRRLEGRRG